MGIKGQKKTPGSGRKKGSVNKNTLAVSEKCAALGLDPVTITALFAKGDWKKLGYKKANMGPFGSPTIPPALRAKCALDLVEFIYPKLKSVEFKDTSTKPKEIVVYDTEWRTVDADAEKDPEAVSADASPAPGTSKPPQV